MNIDRIREEMTVISADDRCVGFVTKLEDSGTLEIKSVSAGYGYHHLIPLSWVSDVDKMVYLDKTSTYVTSNWRGVRFRGAARPSDPPPLGNPAAHLLGRGDDLVRAKPTKRRGAQHVQVGDLRR